MGCCPVLLAGGSPVSQSLSRWQAVVLGLVVALAVGLSGAGLARIAAKQGLWADTVEVTVAFPDVHDVAPGCPVRVRGVDAGQVVAVEYPDTDGPDAGVTVRMRLDAKFAPRLYADASAQIHSTGLLGQKVIAVTPGNPKTGPLADGRLKATTGPDLAKTAEQVGDLAGKVGRTADEAKALISDVRDSRGTVGKLLKDDDLYRELKGLAVDTRRVVTRADAAVGTVESEVGNVRALVQDGRDTLKSVKQSTDAVAKLPVIRGYVTDTNAILVRPDCRREAWTYASADLFEPGTAILTDTGRFHLGNLAGMLKGGQIDRNAELVVAAAHDPADTARSSAAAAELTRKQADAVAEFLRANGVHKLGWWTRRKITPVGLGSDARPAREPNPPPASAVQVIAFTPAG